MFFRLVPANAESSPERYWWGGGGGGGPRSQEVGWGGGWERDGVGGHSHKLYVFFHRSPPVINLMVSVDVKQH